MVAQQKISRNSSGFTIVEVLIVLAIAGLIMLIVFLAVPQLQRMARNHQRKQAVEYAFSELEQYKAYHNGKYPLNNVSETCATKPACADFKNQLQSNGVSQNYSIQYYGDDMAHEYPFFLGDGPDNHYDEVVLFGAHRCNRDPSAGPGSADFPVLSASPSGFDTNFSDIAVYTMLEPNNQIYCIDTGSNP
jgi:prepilin-type N-terminal cleavage/methylation domain-containing protein